MEEFLPYLIEYLPGNKMPADGLSRLPNNRSCSLVTSTTLTSDLDEARTATRCSVSLDQLYDLQCQDKYIKAVVCYLRYQKLPTSGDLRKFVTRLAPQVVIRQGVVGLVKKDRFLALAPYHLQPVLLQLAHDTKLAGHFGPYKTLWNLQQSWYWVGMSQDVDNYCQSCVLCQKVNPPANMKPAPLGTMPSTTRFNERVHIDLLGPLPPSPQGNKYVLVACDAHSSLVHFAPIPDKTAPTVAQAFINGWISQHSLPDTLNSDLGSEFRNDTFKALCLKLGIDQRFSSVMHPMSNGQVERTNRSLLAYVRKFITTNSEWESLLPTLALAINAAPHASKRHTPFQIAYARRPTMPSDALNPARTYSLDDTAQRLALLARITDDVLHHQAQAHAHQKAQYDKRSANRSFAPGDIVYSVRPHTGALAQKFQPKFDGPWQVLRRLPNNNFELLHGHTGRRHSLHVNLLKPGQLREQFYRDPARPALPSPPPSDREMLFERTTRTLRSHAARAHHFWDENDDPDLEPALPEAGPQAQAQAPALHPAPQPPPPPPPPAAVPPAPRAEAGRDAEQSSDDADDDNDDTLQGAAGGEPAATDADADADADAGADADADDTDTDNDAFGTPGGSFGTPASHPPTPGQPSARPPDTDTDTPGRRTTRAKAAREGIVLPAAHEAPYPPPFRQPAATRPGRGLSIRGGRVARGGRSDDAAAAARGEGAAAADPRRTLFKGLGLRGSGRKKD
jgi:hypothetical protein